MSRGSVDSVANSPGRNDSLISQWWNKVGGGNQTFMAILLVSQTETLRPLQCSRSRAGFTLNIIDTPGLVEGGGVNDQALEVVRRWFLHPAFCYGHSSHCFCWRLWVGNDFQLLFYVLLEGQGPNCISPDLLSPRHLILELLSSSW